MEPLILRQLGTSDEAAFRKAVNEFAKTDPDWEFALYINNHFDSQTKFSDYVDSLERGRQGLGLDPRWVPSTFLVAVVGERIIGRVSFRHELNDFLRNHGGHVGFGVVASARRRGYGREMLRQTLPLAKQQGIERLLVTCSDQNAPSRRIIESCGGVLEDVRARKDGERGGFTRRYWIDLSI